MTDEATRALARNERYLREVVEQFELCPFARHCREEGALERRVLLQKSVDAPAIASVIAELHTPALAHVEIGLLIDTYDRLGLDGIAQVNLGVRTHRNRPLTELAAMSRQVIATLLSRCGIPDSGVGLTQFFADGDDYTPRSSTVSLADRPPMVTLRPR